MHGPAQPASHDGTRSDSMSHTFDHAALSLEIDSRPFAFNAGPPPGRSNSKLATAMKSSTSSHGDEAIDKVRIVSAMPPSSTIPAKRAAPIDDGYDKQGLRSIHVAQPSANATNAIGLGGAQITKKSAASQGTSDFIKKLYAMLEEAAFKHIVVWGPRQDSFVVKDMNDFTRIVLPQHFKHSNFASFVRQLNKYDFHKVKNPETKEPSDSHSGTSKEFVPDTLWEFKHPNFSLAQKANAETIKRKAPLTKKADSPSVSGPTTTATNYFSNPLDGESVTLLSKQINALAHNQRQIETHLNKFTAEYHALLADVLGQHRAIAAQDAFTATTLQYVINLESRLLAITNPADSPQFPPSQEAQQLIATYSDLSRARYDKMTETSRRAEALGVVWSTAMQNGIDGEVSSRNVFRPGSAPQTVLGPTPLRHAAILPDLSVQAADESPIAMSAESDSPDGALNIAHLEATVHPSATTMYAATDAINRGEAGYPNPGFDALQASHVGRVPRHQPYRPTSAPQGSPSTVNASPESFDGTAVPATPAHPSFANLGEVNLSSSNRRLHNRDVGSGLQSMRDADDASYFPMPGSAPLLPSAAITPGAVMISHIGPRSKPVATAGAVLNPSRTLFSNETVAKMSPAIPPGLPPNGSLGDEAASRPVDAENIAAFAAALKGGQSSTAVRSALTNQPLLVRRATYIPGWSQAPRVLLVEDDLVCRNLTTKFLQLFGCTIEIAVDGVEAVNKMQNGVYDICMMDISLPNMDGVSATSLIRQFDAMTPIISMTGNSRPDEVLTYFSYGMNDCLPKPFTKEGMLSMLEKHLLHLKQMHANPDLVPDTQALDKFDPDNYDPAFNPFHSFGLSNEDFQNIMSGTMPGVIRSPSAAATPPSLGSMRTKQLANERSGTYVQLATKPEFSVRDASIDSQANIAESGRHSTSSNDSSSMAINKRTRFQNILV